MALEIRRGPPQGIIADRRLYLTREGGNVDGKPGQRVVEEGDREAAWLLATPGSLIDALEVERLGLELVDGKVVQRKARIDDEPKSAEPAAAAPAAAEEDALAASRSAEAEPPKPKKSKRGE